MKISAVGAELFHANRRTDGWTDRHDETNRCFSQFLRKAPKISTFCPHCIFMFFCYVSENKQHSLIGFYEWDSKWLLHGTKWVFKFNGLRVVLKVIHILLTMYTLEWFISRC